MFKYFNLLLENISYFLTLDLFNQAKFRMILHFSLFASYKAICFDIFLLSLLIPKKHEYKFLFSNNFSMGQISIFILLLKSHLTGQKCYLQNSA